MLATLNLVDRPSEEALTELQQNALHLLDHGQDVELNCSSLNYLDLGTLQLLLALGRALAEKGRKLRAREVGNAVEQWLRISGATDLLTLTDANTL